MALVINTNIGSLQAERALGANRGTMENAMQRLASGNTLICEGAWGRIFEVTPKGEILWNYINPFFVPDDAPRGAGSNAVFRAYRYAADSPEIRGRLGANPG